MQQDFLEIHIRNSAMVSLSDLSDSMNALADEFRAFCDGHERDCRAELMVKEIRRGSIDMLLASSVAALVPIAENFNTIVEFGAHLKAVLSSLHSKSAERESIPMRTLENVRRFVAPTVKDAGGTAEITVNGSGNTVNVYNYGSAEARAISESAQYVEDTVRLPEMNIFKGEVMYFSQVRDARGNIGDRAVIERFARTPKKVIYVDQDFKRSVIESERFLLDEE